MQKGASTTTYTFQYDTSGKAWSHTDYPLGQMTLALVQSSQGTVSYYFRHGILGRLLEREIDITSATFGNASSLSAYSDLPSGLLSSLTQDGETLSYGFDDLGRVTTINSTIVGNILLGVSYNDRNQITQLDLGNGISIDRNFREGLFVTPDGDLRLGQIRAHLGGQDLLNLNFDYEAVGNLKIFK